MDTLEAQLTTDHGMENERLWGIAAYAWSRTRMGVWAVVQSPICGTTITIKRLMQKGYVPMLDIYKRISPQLNEPLYTRTVRTVV